MKKLFLFIIIACSCGLFAEYHSLEKTPKEKQLYMVVALKANEEPERRQVFIVTCYDKERPIRKDLYRGWRDVTKEDLWDWCNNGGRLVWTKEGLNQDLIDRLSELIKSK